jgi:hypothetical protein
MRDPARCEAAETLLNKMTGMCQEEVLILGFGSSLAGIVSI